MSCIPGPLVRPDPHVGPYRLVSHQPGIEVVLEANTDYWRQTPHVKRLVMKSVPEATTRLAMLKKQVISWRPRRCL